MITLEQQLENEKAKLDWLKSKKQTEVNKMRIEDQEKVIEECENRILNVLNSLTVNGD